MAGEKETSKSLPVRQRKAHRKSRLGCGNCKLRGVKCDETKPTCKRCVASGFECDYSSKTSSLQLALGAGGAATMKLSLNVPVPRPSRGLPPPAPGFRIPVAGPVAGGPMGSYELTPADFAALERFRSRSVETVGTSKTRRIYRDGAFDIGSTNPFLFHIFLAFSLLHDTFLSPTRPSAAHRSSLAFHWYHGTALFHRNLCAATQSPPHKIPGTHRDALWVSAALLGSAAFAFVGSSDPNLAWPLKEPDLTDLDWLKMSDGKKVVWTLVEPTRPDSLFHNIFTEQAIGPMPNGLAPIPPDAFPKSFYSLFNLDTTTAFNNPYYVAASIVAQMLPLVMNDDNILAILSFITQLDPRYRKLLEERDKKSMIILMWWYAKIASFPRWWLSQRVWTEGIAICIYLERECGDDPVITELMEYPRSVLLGQMGEKDVEHNAACVPGLHLQDRLKGYLHPRITWIT